MNPYKQYKPSGVEWLGEVPVHWEVVALKFYFDVQLGKMLQPKQESEDDIEIPYFKAVDTQWEKINTENLAQMWCNLKDIEKYEVKNGDLLVCEGGEVGRCGIVSGLEHQAIMQNAVHRIRPTSKTDTKFLHYFIKHIANAQWFSILCNKATIAHLTSEKLLNTAVVIPPFPEQAAIADYLDERTAYLDRLIAKQQALSEKLSEKRTALITEAVCGRLHINMRDDHCNNPNGCRDTELTPALRDSGIQWLGEIPEHWEIMALKFSLEIPITDGPHETPEILSDGIPFLSAEAVKNDRLDFDKKRGYISEEDDLRFSKKYKPKRGDVYMVKSGATTGNVARVETDEHFNIWSPLAVMRPNKEIITTDYLFYFLKSKYFFTCVENRWSYGTQQNIGMNVLSNIRVVIPPLSEQTAIAAYLDKETAKIDRLQVKIAESVARLQEYRAALITQVVTGKVQVAAPAV